MPLFHCRKCHHEWEGVDGQDTCDWCHTDKAMILEEKTELKTFIDAVLSNPDLAEILFERPISRKKDINKEAKDNAET